MKTIELLLCSAVFGALTATSHSQIVFEDNSGAAYDTAYYFMGLRPNYNQDLNLELLYGSAIYSPSFVPVVTLLLSSDNEDPSGPQLGQTLAGADDILFNGGTIFDSSYQEFDLGSAYQNRTDYFQVLAWTGPYSSFGAAVASQNKYVYAGASSIFAEFVPASLSVYPPADISNVGLIYLVPIPEPAVLPVASAGLALASTLLFRRRKP
jgi:hypothetical protein